MTCTAVSYPQADPETDYIIQHPIGLSVVHTHIAPGLSGIIYEIGSAMDTDNGTYTCHVIVIRMDRSVTNEREEYLTVTNVAGKKVKLMYPLGICLLRHQLLFLTIKAHTSLSGLLYFSIGNKD